MYNKIILDFQEVVAPNLLTKIAFLTYFKLTVICANLILSFVFFPESSVNDKAGQ